VHAARRHLISDAGIEREVSVVVCGSSPEAVMVVTDADGLFGLVVDTVELMRVPGLVPDLAVIGVGYPHAVSIHDTIAARTFDLTPTAWRAFPGSGGGPAFARFLTDLVMPIAARTAPGVPVHYVGHSLGGMFGAWLLLGGNPFDGYILGSPSLWWHRHALLGAEIPDVLGAEVFVGIGGLETDAGRRQEAANLPPRHPLAPPATFLDMVADVDRWVDRLRTAQPTGLRLAHRCFPDEYHATVLGPVLTHGLRHLFETRT
jgi:uncharacterized protein